MKPPPVIETERLVLRPFCPGDAEDVARYAGAYEVAATTLNIPHPYTLAMAREWIARHEPDYREGKSLCLALTLKAGSGVIGAVSLGREPGGTSAELGYWLGLLYWNCGYMTEAAHALAAWAFDHWSLSEIHSHHLARNPASGRVMEKIGMRRLEAREVTWKDERRELAVFYVLGRDGLFTDDDGKPCPSPAS